MNTEELEKEINAEARDFVKRHFKSPTETDYMMIALAMKTGSTIALEYVLKG